jgi:putative tryptophan/tyrosine transport system substrate-binding protein
MRRRDFIGLVGGAATAPSMSWPFLARAQQAVDGVPRVGILMGGAESDPAGQARVAAFFDELRALGKAKAGNPRIEIRWGGADIIRVRAEAAELVRSKPDVILAQSERAVTALQEETRTIPIVFIGLSDPVGRGVVQSVAKPGGNFTGFTIFDFDFSVMGKLLQMLKQAAPGLARVGLMYNPVNSAAAGWIRTLGAIAPSFSVSRVDVPVHDATEIESAIAAFAIEPNGGLLLPGDTTTAVYRQLIADLAAKNRLSSISGDRIYAMSGCLMSYGPDRLDMFRRAAAYVDRILKGEKPSDLPVQAPTKFELVINLKTAKALDLDIPPGLLTIADEVIE